MILWCLLLRKSVREDRFSIQLYKVWIFDSSLSCRRYASVFSTCCSDLIASGFMPNYIVLLQDRQQVTKLKWRLWTSNRLFQRAAQLSDRAELDDASSLKVKRQTNILLLEEETNHSVARRNQSQISSTGHFSGSPDHHLLSLLRFVEDSPVSLCA